MTTTTTADAPGWELDADHVEFQRVVRGFVDREVRPVVDEAERAGRPPRSLWKAWGAAGLLGLGIDEADGGTGGDALAITLFAEEMARASGGLAVSALVSGYMAAPHIAAYGTAEQRAKYLPAIAAGTSIAAIAVTEPGAGSNVAGMTTRAEATADGFALSGTKMFITNGGIADVTIVAARTGGPGHGGITTFLVETGTPGLSVGEPLRKLGWHGSDTREVVLDGCVVPADAVLGEQNRGFHQIMERFQLERVVLAAMGLGHAAECLAAATEYARERQVFGGPLLALQTIRHRLAAMTVELEAARLLTYQAAARLDSGHPDAPRSVAIAKYHAAIAASRIVDDALQLFGGSGYLEETPVARHYRDVRILRIGGGTDEIQLEVLAKDLTR